jgi:hypothetical protein
LPYPQILPLHAGCDCFAIISVAPVVQVKNQPGRTCPHFPSYKSINNQFIKSYALLLSFCWLLSSLPPEVESAARDVQHTTHGNTLEFVCMVMHKGVLHFRLLAKYAASFFTMPSSSACSAS